MTAVYEEFIDFIARGTTPEQIVAFQASDATKARVADLLRREKTATLSPSEKTDLRHYLELEHLMRLVKAKARQHISTSQ
jgi:hypothetical protein